MFKKKKPPFLYPMMIICLKDNNHDWLPLNKDCNNMF